MQEIHIMEVEFLSNVRYNLFVSKEEWTQWHSKLSRFADFFEKALRMPPENEFAPTTPVHQISPIADVRRYNLPVSPASKIPSPPSTNPLQPQTQLQPQIQSRPAWNPTTAPYRLNNSPRALPNFEFPPYSRKRSWEDDVEENPSKRMAVSNYSAPMPAMPVSATSMPSAAAMSVPVLPPVLGANNMPLSVPSLAIPVPRLSQPTTYQPVSTALIPPPLPAATMPQQLPLPHVRAMSTVFNPSSTWSQPIPSATAPVVPTQTSNPMALYNSAVSLPDPGRRQSPYSATVSSDAVSPSSAFHVHTPQNHLSPSFFLVNRNSPYRPVRAVNTLLIPPPSASLHQPRHLSMDQMHYQPLGKSFTERRTGVLPYLHHDGLPQGVIPQQPNFLPSQY